MGDRYRLKKRAVQEGCSGTAPNSLYEILSHQGQGHREVQMVTISKDYWILDLGFYVTKSLSIDSGTGFRAFRILGFFGSFYGFGFGFQGFRMLVFSRMHGFWFHSDCWIFGFFKDLLDSVFYGFSDFSVWSFFGFLDVGFFIWILASFESINLTEQTYCETGAQSSEQTLDLIYS